MNARQTHSSIDNEETSSKRSLSNQKRGKEKEHQISFNNMKIKKPYVPYISKKIK